MFVPSNQNGSGSGITNMALSLFYKTTASSLMKEDGGTLALK
jgi:hypothetical protein